MTTLDETRLHYIEDKFVQGHMTVEETVEALSVEFDMSEDQIDCYFQRWFQQRVFWALEDMQENMRVMRNELGNIRRKFS